MMNTSMLLILSLTLNLSFLLTHYHLLFQMAEMLVYGMIQIIFNISLFYYLENMIHSSLIHLNCSFSL
jgi:hypothetical protein